MRPPFALPRRRCRPTGVGRRSPLLVTPLRNNRAAAGRRLGWSSPGLAAGFATAAAPRAGNGGVLGLKVRPGVSRLGVGLRVGAFMLEWYIK